MPVLPFGEYRPDVSDYSGQHTRRILNVLPRGDGYGPFPSFVPLTSALPGICRGFFYARTADGGAAVFAGTAQRLYKLNNTTYAWDNVTKGGDAANYTAVPNDDSWVFRQFNLDVIATQINTVPQVYRLGSATDFIDLAGAPAVRYCDVVNRFLVLSGFDSGSTPFKIQWSGYNAITTWTAGVSQSDSQEFPTGGIVRGVAGGETGYVFSDSAVRRMTYNPGSPAIFNFDVIEEDVGLFAPQSVIRSRERVFWLGPDGFKMMTAGGYPQNIGQERVNRTVFLEMDQTALQCIQGVGDPNSSRVGWVYRTTAGGVSDCWNRLLVYDWSLDRWAPVNMEGQYIASLVRPSAYTLEGLNAIAPFDTGGIDAPSGTPFDDFLSSALPVVGMFDDNNMLGFFTGANLEAQLETSERQADGKRIYVRGFRPVTDAPTVFGRLRKRDLNADTATLTAEKQMNRIGNVPVHADNRFVRGQIRIPEGEAWSFATGIEPVSRSTGGQ
jgi:hypothetical protein